MRVSRNIPLLLRLILYVYRLVKAGRSGLDVYIWHRCCCWDGGTEDARTLCLVVAGGGGVLDDCRASVSLPVVNNP